MNAPKLSKAERLYVAGQVAPSLRRRVPRKVKLVDAEGAVVREATDVDVAQGALARLGIEISMQPTRARADQQVALERIQAVASSRGLGPAWVVQVFRRMFE